MQKMAAFALSLNQLIFFSPDFHQEHEIPFVPKLRTFGTHVRELISNCLDENPDFAPCLTR